jgi:hypothetical protein
MAITSITMAAFIITELPPLGVSGIVDIGGTVESFTGIGAGGGVIVGIGGEGGVGGVTTLTTFCAGCVGVV